MRQGGRRASGWSFWFGVGWTKGTKGVDTSILYCADEVRKAIEDDREILCVEGEKDVDNLWRIGFAATCNAHGASEPDKRPKWTKAHSEQLRGASILVLNDNDDAGRAHAEATCKCSRGVVARVRRFDFKDHWPDMPEGGDVSDWLAAGHSGEELEELLAAAPIVFEAPAGESADVSGDPLSESEPDDGPEAGTETEREARKRRYRKFSMTETGGLFRRVGISEPPQWEHVCQPFTVLGYVRAPANPRGERENWGKLISFADRDGVSHLATLTDADLHRDAGALVASLADKGMNIEGSLTAHRAFVEYLLSVNAETPITLARRGGWQSLQSPAVYMLTDEMAVKESGAAVEKTILAATVYAPYEKAGTLAGWRRDVGQLAKGHRLAMLAISTALASPLLYVAGYENGGVHVCGWSSIGKTSSLRLGASVWGKGVTGGTLRSWRSTSNALEATLSGACDVGMVIDEIGQIDGRELGQTLYMAANGIGKQRMRADASLRDAYTWRLFVLSSGEDPIEVKLNEDRKRARAGQLARMLDIPVSERNGAFGDNLVDFDGGAFAAECMRAATTVYGTAGPAFVKALIDRDLTPGSSAARDKLRGRVDNFVAKVVTLPDGQTLRAAQRLGLIGLAGELAIEFDIVPWEAGSAEETAQWAFARWYEARGGTVPYEARAAVGRVRHFIEAHGDSRFEDLDLLPDPDRKPVVNRAGYRDGKDEGRRWYVLPEVWTREVCEGLNPHEAAVALRERGMLKADPRGKLAKVKRINGKPLRLYTLNPSIFDGSDDE